MIFQLALVTIWHSCSIPHHRFLGLPAFLPVSLSYARSLSHEKDPKHWLWHVDPAAKDQDVCTPYLSMNSLE
jgi:hypothetical protein